MNKIEKTKDALSKIKNLKEKITAYCRQASDLCHEMEEPCRLDDKIAHAKSGLDVLISYMKEIIDEASHPHKFRAIMDYAGKYYQYNLDLDKCDRNYDDEEYCYWIRPLNPDDANGKWLEINMIMEENLKGEWLKPTENGYAVVYSSYEEMMQSGDGELQLPDVKFCRI